MLVPPLDEISGHPMAQLEFLLLVRCYLTDMKISLVRGKSMGFELHGQFKSSLERLRLTPFQLQPGIPIEDGVNKLLFGQQVLHIIRSERIG